MVLIHSAIVLPTAAQSICVIAMLRLEPKPLANAVTPLLIVVQSRFPRAELTPIAIFNASSVQGNVSANDNSAWNAPLMPVLSV